MRRFVACLLACSVAACSGGTVSSPARSGATAAPPASIRPNASGSAGAATATESPVAVATNSTAGTPAWTNQAVALSPAAGDETSASVHLGANFPLVLTEQSPAADGSLWFRATVQTPGRQAFGWLPASSVTFLQPAGGATAGVDALDVDLAAYLNGLGNRIGVDVFDVTRGVEYKYNADLSFYAASSMKVPIMLALLAQLDARHREPTADQLALMTEMIENSINDAATELYKEVGWQRGMRQFMDKVGIGGLYAEVPTIGWGHSTITAAAMVALLSGLNDGTILADDDRAFALRLMRHIESDQRVGVGDSSPAGATIAMKDGWTSAADEQGPYVMNSSGIVTLGGETYVIAVYTSGNRSYPEGFDITRHVCKVVGEKLMGPAQGSGG
jgi:beta-lactamase class A